MTESGSMDVNNQLLEVLGKLDDAVNSANEKVNKVLERDYEALSAEYKARRNLFLSFFLCTVVWLHLWAKGINPHTTKLKTEIDRLRSYTTDLTAIVSKKDQPRVDKGAVKRFVRSSLWSNEEANAKRRKLDTSD